MKKLTALILAVAMLLGVSVISVSADDIPERSDIIFVESEEALQKLDRDNIPVVTVPGFGEAIYRNLHTEDESDDTTVFGPDVKLLVPAIFKYAPGLLWAIVTKNYELLNEKLGGFLLDVFSDIGCNPDGTMKEGTGGKYDNSLDFVKKKEQAEKNKELKNGYANDYYFNFDWRKDMHTLAFELREYIEDVKAATDCEKIAITAFSQGACIVMTYLYEYYYTAKDISLRDEIHSVVFICGAMNGVSSCADPVSGNIGIESISFLRYFKTVLGESIAFDMLVKLYDAGLFDKVVDFAKEYIEKHMDSAIDPYLISTFGGIPGFFAMMSPERYEDAEEFLFGTPQLQEKYAGLLEKNRYYHEKVQPNMKKMLDTLMKEGKNIGIIAEYGYPIAPFTADNDRMTDLSICTTHESFGAVCSDVDDILGLDYKQTKKCKCKKNHVSCDLQIDASACLYPDITWFGKNLKHDPSSRFWADLVDLIIYSEKQITVWDYADLPQFMVNYEDRFLVPLTNDGTYAVPFKDTLKAKNK